MKNQIKLYLILAILFMELGGLGLHYTVHNPLRTGYGFVPITSGLLSIGLIPVLFIFRRTLHLAYLLNGFTVIVGVIAMSYFSLTRFPVWQNIMILLSKFIIGRAIFTLEMYQLKPPPKIKGWNYIRYPNMGFWIVHLVLFAVVFILGRVIWSNRP